MTKIYFVKNYGGQWEDAYETLVGIYSNKKNALDVAENEWNKRYNWKNIIPIPFDVYTNAIEEELFELNHEDCVYDDDIIFKDMFGYTKEQWITTHNIVIENQYSEYSHTCAYEAILLEDNTTYYDECNYNIHPHDNNLGHPALREIFHSGTKIRPTRQVYSIPLLDEE